MARLLNIVLYVVLVAWLIAVVLPLGWVVVNSLRSSIEFVEAPFGAPWLLTGSPYADDDRNKTEGTLLEAATFPGHTSLHPRGEFLEAGIAPSLTFRTSPRRYLAIL